MINACHRMFMATVLYGLALQNMSQILHSFRFSN